MKKILTISIAAFFATACNQSTKKDVSTEGSISADMAQTLRQSMKKDLKGSEIEKTNDLDAYCDCIVDSLRSGFTKREIMEPEFTDSKKYRKVSDTCLKSTKLP